MPKNSEITPRSGLAMREKRALSCPKCGEKLFIVYHDEIEVDTCLKCNGVWIDPIKQISLLRNRPAGLSIEELQQLRKFFQPLGKLETVRYFPCPVCKQMMNRKNWGSYSGVIVDFCKNHGTWYDDQELDKIQEYVRLGGAEFEKIGRPKDEMVRLTGRIYHEVQRLDKRITTARILNFLFGI